MTPPRVDLFPSLYDEGCASYRDRTKTLLHTRTHEVQKSQINWIGNNSSRDVWRLQLQLDAINISNVASDILNRQCADCGDRYYRNTGSEVVEIPNSETEGSLKDFNKTFERTLRKLPR